MPSHVRPGRGSIVALLFGATIFSLAACDDGASLSNVRSRLVVDPEAGTRLDFGAVVLTRTEASTIEIKVKNEGDGVLELEEPTFTGQGAADFGVVSSPHNVAPGQSSVILVRYVPVSPGESEVTMTVASNDPD